MNENVISFCYTCFNFKLVSFQEANIQKEGRLYFIYGSIVLILCSTTYKDLQY